MSATTSFNADAVTVLQFVPEPDLQSYELCVQRTPITQLCQVCGSDLVLYGNVLYLLEKFLFYFFTPNISDKRVVYYEGVQASS